MNSLEVSHCRRYSQPGRLTFELLRCRREPTPLTWEPVGAITDGPILAVENHATLRTVLRWRRTQPSPRWVAVC